MEHDKKTLGQLANEFFKPQDIQDDIREYTRELGKDLITVIHETVASGLKHDAYKNKDFYIVVIHDIEKLTQVPRNRVFHRLTCPTPTFTQSVWKYHRDSSSLEFLWSIPTKIRHYYLVHNFHTLDKDDIDQAKMCILFENGELDEWVKKENNEFATQGLRLIEKADA